MINREKLTQYYVECIIENMSIARIEKIVSNVLTEDLNKISYADLVDEVNQYHPHLLD